MFLLQYGAECVPQSLSMRGGGDSLYWEPFIGVLVETGDGWVLLDTGMGRPTLDLTGTHDAYRSAAGGHDPPRDWMLTPHPPNDPETWCWGLGDDPLEAALAPHGLAPSDLAVAAVSHLHFDHSGGIPALARAGVPVAVQRPELDFASSGAVGLADGFHAHDWQHPGTEWRLLDGDTELAPGVHCLSTPGHTPGHMSFRVDLRDTGTWLFAVDAADLAQNLLDNVPCGSVAAGRPEDEADAEKSLARLFEAASSLDARLVPGHDQVVLNAIRHPSGGHR